MARSKQAPTVTSGAWSGRGVVKPGSSAARVLAAEPVELRPRTVARREARRFAKVLLDYEDEQMFLHQNFEKFAEYLQGARITFPGGWTGIVRCVKFYGCRGFPKDAKDDLDIYLVMDQDDRCGKHNDIEKRKRPRIGSSATRPTVLWETRDA